MATMIISMLMLHACILILYLQHHLSQGQEVKVVVISTVMSEWVDNYETKVRLLACCW